MKQSDLFLCSGLQSGGTSVISWCFLQRQDLDGVFDMENSVIQTDFSQIKTNKLWVKMTIGSFSSFDIAGVYKDLGYKVIPLLVIRDVRYAYSSLIKKEYGQNGNTAEDPPLKLRYRRFLDDWLMFRDRNLPILRFESFIKNPGKELMKLTQSLGLPWDDAMINWNKAETEISYFGEGNETFRLSRNKKNNIHETLADKLSTRQICPISEYDLKWLETMFKEYNLINDYPEHLENFESKKILSAPPNFNVTSRYKSIRKMNDLNEKYWDINNKLERINNHIIFGPMIRLWSICINKKFKVFEDEN